VAEEGNYQARRLWKAAVTAFAGLDEHGFRLQDRQLDWWRGASVVATADMVAIAVGADWLEGELSVSVQVAGAGPVAIENVIPPLRYAVRRLPRDPTRGVLERRLRLVVAGIRSHAPELLLGGDEALERVLKAGAPRA
jgi:hypothetical protein